MPSNYNKSNNKMSKGLKLIAEFYKEPTQKLIKLLIEKHGYSYEKLEPILGVSRQAIRDNWMRPVIEETNSYYPKEESN